MDKNAPFFPFILTFDGVLYQPSDSRIELLALTRAVKYVRHLSLSWFLPRAPSLSPSPRGPELRANWESVELLGNVRSLNKLHLLSAFEIYFWLFTRPLMKFLFLTFLFYLIFSYSLKGPLRHRENPI